MASSSSSQDSSLIRTSLQSKPLFATTASRLTINFEGRGPIIDASAGATAAVLGHGNTEVMEAVTAQMQKLSYVMTQMYTHDPAEQLADLLVESAGHGFTKAFLVGSGSEANDAAMKLACQYFVEKGQPQRTHFISRRLAYHGNTIGAMSLTTSPLRTRPFEGILMPNVSHVSPCYAYQYKRDDQTEQQYVERLAEGLDDEFERVGTDKVIAFMGETVMGSISGCVPPIPGYWPAIQAVCRKHGALLIIDEIMCGLGRTGSMYPWQDEGMVPDIVTFGKGLGAGYIPIAALIAQGHIMHALDEGSGIFYQSITFQAHAVACAAALAVQRIIKRDKLVENSRKMGLVLERLLHEHMGSKKYVGNIRGRGLFYAVEFVRDKTTKVPFDSAIRLSTRVHQAALDRGVHVYPGVGVVDGYRGDHVMFAPAFIVNEEELKLIVAVTEAAYDAVEKEIDAS